jgi:hypothetical protein
MPLPNDYNTVTVTGRYTYLNGEPAVGSVRFTGKGVAVSAETETVILPGTVVATLVNGEFSIELPATNDPDIQPNGWTYSVEERFSNGGGRKYEIDVPYDALRIDLSTVAPVPSSPGDPTAYVTLSAFEALDSAFEQHLLDGGEGGGVSSWNDLTDKPSAFPPEVHDHEMSDVTGLTDALSGKSAANHTHEISGVNGLTAALADKASASALTSHTSNTSNPHAVTKAQVGLGNVSNLAPADLPVSTATQTALDAKRDILVLATGESVPGGTRTGTIIFRTA